MVYDNFQLDEMAVEITGHLLCRSCLEKRIYSSNLQGCSHEIQAYFGGITACRIFVIIKTDLDIIRFD